MPALDALFDAMSLAEKKQSVEILAEELIRQDPLDDQQLAPLLERHGYRFVNGRFLPVAVMDPREKAFLPAAASDELARAAERIASGDHSGAITSACGAVDAVMQAVYQAFSLGDPGKVSFQAKVNTAVQQLQIFQRLHADLVRRGVNDADAKEIVENAGKATNHAAQSLQVLRRTMGDAHGSKPASDALAYDAVKWAAAICALFEGRI